MNLLNLLTESTLRNPQKPALVTSSGASSFEELLNKGKQRGEFLRTKGIGSNDPVLVLVPMSIELYEVLIGLWHIGAIPVFFDPSAGNSFIEKCCETIKPKAMVGIRKAMLLGWISKAIGKIPLKISLNSFKRLDDYTSGSQFADLDDDFPGLMTFTSGSTGLPKGIVRSHGFLMRQYNALSETMQYQPSDIELGTLPVFALSNLAAGITTVIPSVSLKAVGSIDGEKIFQQILETGVNRITASPALLNCLSKYCIDQNKQLPNMDLIHTGGGPVYPSVMERILKAMPNAERVAVYGSSEAEPIAELKWLTLTQEDYKKMSTGMGLPAGKPVGCIDCRILNNSQKHQSSYDSRESLLEFCHDEGIGEIIVTGEHVLKGYYNGYGDTENKIKVGDSEVWHRTGDLGYFDDNKNLWLLGRDQGAIHDEKGDLYPFSVECALNASFGIEKAAILKVKSERILVIERSQQLPEDINQGIKWAKLHKVITVKKLPMDKRHNAKIDYPALKRLIKD